MNGYIGICRFCGQSVALDREYETEDAANIAASETCDCPGAKTERATQKQIEAGEHRVRQVFGDEAERLGFRPVDSPEPIELMGQGCRAYRPRLHILGDYQHTRPRSREAVYHE